MTKVPGFPAALLPLSILAVVLLAPLALAAEENKGPFKGDAFLKVDKDLNASEARYYKLTTDFSESATVDPRTNAWDFDGGGSITLRFLNATDGASPPPVPDDTTNDLFLIELYYDNYTTSEHFVRPLYGGTRPPLNNTNFTIAGTSANLKTQTVDSTDDRGQWNSMAMVNESIVFVSYEKEDATDPRLFVANSTDAGKSWRVQNVDASDPLSEVYSSISAVNSSYLFVAYQGTNRDLKVANSTDSGVSWRTQIVDGSSLAAYTSIETVNASIIFIAYHDAGGLDLEFANSSDRGVSWRLQTLESSGNTGDYTSLHVVNESVLYISYHYMNNDDLRVANSTDGGRTWRLQDVDTGGIVGLWTSIDGVKDTVYVSYYDDTNDDLRLAKSTNAGSTWTTSTVDSAGTVGEYTSIYVKNESVVYVTYYDSTSDNLKLAKSTDGGSTWSLFLLDTGSDVGQYTSISGVNDTIYVSYYDATNADLKVAKLEDTTLPRAGVFRIKMRSLSAASGVTDYDATTDVGITDATQAATYDAIFSQGFVRASLNLTNFTTYKDSAYAQNNTKFMRGETVYLEFKTDASAWNDTGIETSNLIIDGQDATTKTIGVNLTFANNTYRTSWTTPADADLDNYEVSLRIAGSTKAFKGDYQLFIADPGVDLILENGSTITLDGTNTYRDVVIRNNSKINVGSGGNLTLRADGTIRVEAGSMINATGAGGAGGAGGSIGGEQCDSITDGQAGSGDRPGGGGDTLLVDTVGAGGGGGGHGGIGANGVAPAVTSSAGAGGGTIGSATDRTAKKGSGGGGGSGTCIQQESGAKGGRGGNGGGIIILEADGNVTIDGIVEARGMTGEHGKRVVSNEVTQTSGGGGGGSAGTIVLNSSKVVITGSVRAHGGDGGDTYALTSGVNAGGPGGGSGGGRVKIFALELSNMGVLSAGGGLGGVSEPLLAGNHYEAGAGDDGTIYTAAGERWTAFKTSSLGFHDAELVELAIHNISDPDNEFGFRNASFWVEEEFGLAHDYGPRLNFSNTSTIQQYLMRGDVLNYSFVVLDEWNRTFASKEVNVSINTTTVEFNLTPASTGASARVTGQTTIKASWTDSYTNTTPNQLEFRNYTVHVHFPANETNASRGSYGQNNSQTYAFDIDATLYADVHVQNTSTLNKDNMDDSNEQLTYGIGRESVRTWIHVQNVRAEDQNGKNATLWIYPSSLSRAQNQSGFVGTTGSDGWTGLLGTFLAASPAGLWSFDADVGADSNNNSGNDNEAVTFTKVAVGNVTYVLAFNTGPNNNGTLTGRWSCVQDNGNATFVAFVFSGNDPKGTGQFNTTPLAYKINITQSPSDNTHLVFTKGSCTKIKDLEQEIRDGRFEQRNFPAFGFDDVKRYTIKLILDYTNVHFNNNLTWGEGSFRLTIKNNKTTTSLVNISSGIL